VVPQILQILGARAPSRRPPACLRYFVTAAAPLRKNVLSGFTGATGVTVRQGYGLSECVNFATTVPGDIADTTYEEAMFGEKIPSIGTPLEGCDVFVRALRGGGRAPPGEEGEIVVTGETLMSGYWRNEPATRNAIVDGGLRTGDLGFYKVLDGRRFFFITGRIKEIIIRHGEKISPVAVEADLQELHAFGRFAVAGFENAAAGEEVGLYLQVEDPADRAGIARIVNACPPLSRPRLVMMGHQEIPATPTGKVKREVLGKRFASFSGHVFGKEPVIVAEPLTDGRLEQRIG
jgi:long-chain acyl-CoA synthetase